MGFMNSALGMVSGDSGGAGMNYSAGATQIQKPVSEDQAKQAYDKAQSSILQQQNFVDALGAQNGVQNQSNLYGQYGNIAAGNGPNPAQNMLNQATGTNVANQAALMASQRGSGANVGLIARQAAQQGAATQQQAAGQAATLQSNQQLAALNAQSGIAGQQVSNQANAITGLNQAAQSEQQNLLGSIAQQNNAAVGLQSNINSSNAGVSQATAQTQGKVASGVSQGFGALSSLAEGGQVGMPANLKENYKDKGRQKFASGGQAGGQIDPSAAVLPASAPPSSGPQSNAGRFLYGSAQEVNNGLNVAGQQNAGQIKWDDPSKKKDDETPDAGSPSLGSDMGGLDSASGSTMAGGAGDAMGAADAAEGADAAGSMMGLLALAAKGGDVSKLPHFDDGGSAGGGIMSLLPLLALLAKGGNVPNGQGSVPAMVSPGERYLPPSEVKEVVKGKKNPMKAGEEIPGKAKVKGNSYSNDTVRKNLDVGGIVIPRSVTQSDDPMRNSIKFVHATLMKQKSGRGKK